MLFQWTANQQGVVNYQQHGEDHLWEPITCEPTLVDSSVDSLGNLIVRGTPGSVITDRERRHAIVLHCYEFYDQQGHPIPSHSQGRLWVTDIFATQQPTSFLLHYPCHPADFQATPPHKTIQTTQGEVQTPGNLIAPIDIIYAANRNRARSDLLADLEQTEQFQALSYQQLTTPQETIHYLSPQDHITELEQHYSTKEHIPPQDVNKNGSLKLPAFARLRSIANTICNIDKGTCIEVFS